VFVTGLGPLHRDTGDQGAPPNRAVAANELLEKAPADSEQAAVAPVYRGHTGMDERLSEEKIVEILAALWLLTN
jgi:hypothetical protein